ncbi:uncharacterized protein LOC126272804 isoform X2 [Schistocerca gregaria]|uniref:uncharacterized protein LOC126272804 isoform X2 n=1 Tax=Schistocerca gregaria TaxID=7010 RepID=UPI00211F152A|nr:uncharacterized protein LOC126272804 isoform X2 [Schistocerca gregaria]
MFSSHCRSSSDGSVAEALSCGPRVLCLLFLTEICRSSESQLKNVGCVSLRHCYFCYFRDFCDFCYFCDSCYYCDFCDLPPYEKATAAHTENCISTNLSLIWRNCHCVFRPFSSDERHSSDS